MATINRTIPGFLTRFTAALQRSVALWGRPGSVILLAFIVYTGVSCTTGAPWSLSSNPYYNYLADAFLHGQLNLRLIPQETIDLSLYHGNYYLYWGPLPAIFAMPLVALFGVQVSDILPLLVFSALTVGVLAAALQAANRRKVIDLSPAQIGLLVLFFAIGTAYFPITETGHVWQTVQVQSLLFAFLAFWAAFSLENGAAFFLTGCALAGVILTRPSAIFVGIFLAWYLINEHKQAGWLRLLKLLTFAALPILAALALTGWYNAARFGSPLQNGIAYHLMSVFFWPDFQQYGYMNVHFIPGNFFYTYIFYPYSFFPLDARNNCGSMFLLSPLFFMGLVALWQNRKEMKTWVLFVSVVLGTIPLLLLMGPGSGLFGPRYTLDFVMPMLLLTALGMKRLPDGWAGLLVAISALQYLVGGLIYVHTVG